MSDAHLAPKPFGSSIAWTDERVDQLKMLHKLGKMAGEIAITMGGMSRQRVAQKLYELGLTKKAPPKIERDAPVTVPKVRKEREKPEVSLWRTAGWRMPQAPRARLDLYSTSKIPDSAHCNWPIGEPGTSGFHYCGAEKPKDGRSFCFVHRKKSVRPTAEADIEAIIAEAGEE